jgi:cyclic pyranopterin phosphate synthase
MPEEGVSLTPSAELLSTDELLTLVKLFVQHGIRKIRFTGGEPTVRRDLVDIVAAIRTSCPEVQQLAMTTNGIVLARKLPALKEAGLTSLNISLDTLDPNKFMIMTRRAGHERVLEAIQTALQLGFAPLKLNCVVIRGVNDMEMADFVAMTRTQPIDVRFIEYMPFEGNKWKGMSSFFSQSRTNGMTMWCPS